MEPVTADWEEGLYTTVFPATMAADVIPTEIAKGKFHGAITTPTAPRFIEELTVFARGMAHAAWLPQTKHFPAVVFEEINGFANIGVGFVPGLTHFKHLQGRQFIAYLAGCGGGLEEVPGTGAWGSIAPGRKALTGRVNGIPSLFKIRRGHQSHHTLRMIGIGRLKLSIRVHFLAADQQGCSVWERLVYLLKGA